MQLNLHAIEHFSRANGPGRRAVIWFQGCNLGCPNCFNPLTHPADGGLLRDTEDLATEIRELHPKIEGLSISGGEPFQQPDALFNLLQHLSGSGLSILIFSGYTLAEIQQQPLGPSILPYIDVLIAGRYVNTRPVGHSLLGSANQTIHLVSDRYSLRDLQQVPRREFILHGDGQVTSTGIDPTNAGT